MMHHDKERLIAYLYDECEPAERESARAHLAACADCRAELEGLRAVRDDLTEWTPPERSPGFGFIHDAAPARHLAWWPLPAWGLAAAAAVLVLAAASAIANVEIRYAEGGVTIRTGWARADAAAPTVAVAGFGAADGEALKREIAALEQRIQAVQQQGAPAPVVVRQPGGDAEVLRRLRALIEESEQRQERLLAIRVAQLWGAVDAAHRADLERLQHGLGEFQNNTAVKVEQLNRAFNTYVVRTSQQR
jgi:hypothetical protein